MAYFITETCTGCTACSRVCPTGAISGTRSQRHVVDETTCIECGVCSRVCPASSFLNGQGQPCRSIKRSEWAKPVVNPERCTSCGACVQTCPVNALGYTLKEHSKHLLPYLQDEKICISCGFCASTCPVEAIEMKVPTTA
jgi:ferredoxin